MQNKTPACFALPVPGPQSLYEPYVQVVAGKPDVHSDDRSDGHPDRHPDGHPEGHQPAGWQHEQWLDGQGVLLLRWNSSRPDGQGLGQARDDVLQLEVAARTRGYVGLGLSPYTGTMAGADLVLAWVDDTGAAHARVSIHCHAPRVNTVRGVRSGHSLVSAPLRHRDIDIEMTKHLETYQLSNYSGTSETL